MKLVLIILSFGLGYLVCSLPSCRTNQKYISFYTNEDIIHIDPTNFHVGSESGRVDTTFQSFEQMTEFIEDLSVEQTWEEGVVQY